MAEKAKLVVQSGQLAGQELLLGKAGSLSIGRAERNDLTIDDRAISREHCRLDYDGEFYWVIDQSSHNGTIVNGRTITKCMLFDGDLIKVGHTCLTFKLPEEKQDEWD